MALLHAEITRLDWSPTGEGWLLLGFTADDADDFEEALAAVKAINRYQRTYLPRAHCWRVKAAALFTLSARWANLREALADLGVGEEYAHTSYRQAPPPPPPVYAPRGIAEAFAVLQLAPGAPVGLIEVARRYWAKTLHPDLAGGDLEAMKRINVCADACAAYARQVAA